MDVLAMSETKIKGKSEFEFVCLSGRSGIDRKRARK